MTKRTQGNDHKVAGTQIIYEKVAEICSKHGIEFSDYMLTRETFFAGDTVWYLAPYEVELITPGQSTNFRPRVHAGMIRYDCQEHGLWWPLNCDPDDLEDNDIAAFNEVAVYLSETTGTYDSE